MYARSDPPRLDPLLVTRWCDDETFFSVCSRQHIVLNNSKASSTRAWLFGSASAMTSHDLPFNLAALNNDAQAVWGPPRSIIFEHTILPVFLPFQSAQHAAAAIQAMESTSLGSLKYKLGLLTGRFGAEHPLKACTSCIEADITTHGFAYWHLPHQYPGVLICPTHRELLRESRINRQWSGRFQWTLPEETTLAPARPKSIPEPSKQALERITTAVLDLAACGRDRQFDPGIVRAIYKGALSLGNERLAASFAQHCALLQPYPPFTSLPIDPQQVSTFWAQLIRNRESYSHPLKHLVIITWQYGSLSRFIEAYDHTQSLQSSDCPPLQNQVSTHLIKLSTTVELAPPSVANRKPKVLKPAIRASILAQLSSGIQKGSICDAYGVTVSTVNKLLRSEPSVYQSWLCARQMTKVEEHRSEWVSTVKQAPGRSPKDTRAAIPNVYAWLYRNDRDWLLAQTQQMPTRRQGNNAAVDWGERDEKLLELVKLRVSELSSATLGQGVSRAELFLACPTLASALAKRNRYPRTRSLLKSLSLC